MGSRKRQNGGRHPRSIRRQARPRRRWDRVLVPALILLAVSLCREAVGQAQSSSTPSKNSIHGVVINSVTREPVGHALVVTGDNRLATMTDDQGRFELALPDGAGSGTSDSPNQSSNQAGFFRVTAGGGFPAMLTARKPGYLGLDRHSPGRNEITIEGGEVRIALVPEAKIVGRVVLPGPHFEGTNVELYRRQILQGRAYWQYAAAATARSNGDFRFADLEPGTYKLFTGELSDRDPLTVQLNGPLYGYPPIYFPNAGDFQTAASIQLSPGVTFQAELSPTRRQYYPVKIPISNPQEGAQLEVSVSVQGRKGPGFELGYNWRDQRIEGALPEGTYLVQALSEAEGRAVGVVNITVKGGPVEAPPMTLVPTGFIQFKATLERRKAAQSDGQGENTGALLTPGRSTGGELFHVRLEPVDEFGARELIPPSQTWNDTSVTLGGMMPGSYWVRVEPQQGFVAAMNAGDTDLLRQPLRVGLGANLLVDVTLRDDGAELAGTVEDGEGRSVTSSAKLTSGLESLYLGSTLVPAHIYCIPMPESTGQFRQGMALQDGKFDLTELAPGVFRVLAFDRPQAELEYRNSEAMSAYDGKGQVVRLVGGQKENIRLRVIRTGE
jgi:hypothetical protein